LPIGAHVNGQDSPLVPRQPIHFVNAKHRLVESFSHLALGLFISKAKALQNLLGLNGIHHGIELLVGGKLPLGGRGQGLHLAQFGGIELLTGKQAEPECPHKANGYHPQ
jgi:hypothetical protein